MCYVMSINENHMYNSCTGLLYIVLHSLFLQSSIQCSKNFITGYPYSASQPSYFQMSVNNEFEKIFNFPKKFPANLGVVNF